MLSARDVERLEIRSLPSLARRLAGLALVGWAAYGVLAGVRGEAVLALTWTLGAAAACASGPASRPAPLAPRS